MAGIFWRFSTLLDMMVILSGIQGVRLFKQDYMCPCFGHIPLQPQHTIAYGVEDRNLSLGIALKA